APAEEALPLFGDDALDEALARLTLGLVDREEDVARAVAAGRGELDAEALLHHPGEELVRKRSEHACAVAGVRLAAAGSAVIHRTKHPVGVEDGLMRASTTDVGDESHAARVLLERGVVQTDLP